jgi:hypothetical protein
LDWLWAKVPGWRKPLSRRMVARAGAWRAHGWRWSARAAWVMSILCGLSVVSSLAAYGWRSAYPGERMRVTPDQAEAFVDRLIKDHPDDRVHEIPRDGFTVELVRLDDFRVYIGQHEDLNSMTRIYERRDHARWVAEGRVLTSEAKGCRLAMQIPGSLNGLAIGQPLLVVGVINRGYPDKFGKEMPLFEVLGICPAKANIKTKAQKSGSPGEVEPQWEQAVWFKYHFDVKESVRRLFLKKE